MVTPNELFDQAVAAHQFGRALWIVERFFVRPAAAENRALPESLAHTQLQLAYLCNDDFREKFPGVVEHHRAKLPDHVRARRHWREAQELARATAAGDYTQALAAAQTLLDTVRSLGGVLLHLDSLTMLCRSRLLESYHDGVELEFALHRSYDYARVLCWLLDHVDLKLVRTEVN